MRPSSCAALPCAPPRLVLTVAVPEQVAVPFPSVQDVGALVHAVPVFVTFRAVPPAIVLVPVSATVTAELLHELLKLVQVQV